MHIYLSPTNSLLPSSKIETSTKQKEPPTTEMKGKVVLRGHGNTTKRLLELEISRVWRSAKKLNPIISGWLIKQRCILENMPGWERFKALFLTDWVYDNLWFSREVRESLSSPGPKQVLNKVSGNHKGAQIRWRPWVWKLEGRRVSKIPTPSSPKKPGASLPASAEHHSSFPLLQPNELCFCFSTALYVIQHLLQARNGFSSLPVQIRWFVLHCNENRSNGHPSPGGELAASPDISKKFTVFSLLNDATDRSTKTVLRVSSRDRYLRGKQLTTTDYFFHPTTNCKAIKLGRGGGCDRGDCQPQCLAESKCCCITCEAQLPKHSILIHNNYAPISLFVPSVCCCYWISGTVCRGRERLEKSLKNLHQESNFSDQRSKKELGPTDD